MKDDQWAKISHLVEPVHQAEQKLQRLLVIWKLNPADMEARGNKERAEMELGTARAALKAAGEKAEKGEA